MVFIPRWEKYRDKKPATAEYDCNSDFCKLFDALYVFDSYNPDDLIGAGGQLSKIANPGDGGTSKLGGTHDYGVTVTANDVTSGSTQSTKFSADTATGDTATFWHKEFFKGSFFADCTLSAIVGGPMNLFGVGGRINGAELMFRSNPKKLSIITSNNSSKVEAQSTSVFNPDNTRIKILGTFDNGSLKLFVLSNGTASLEAQTTAAYTTIPAHSATPDILGAGSSNAAGDSSYSIIGDGWNGDCYSLGISKSYAPSDDEAIAFLEAPYQILKPRRRWFVFGSGTSGFTVIINSAGEVVSANQLTGAKLLNLSNSAETSLAQQTGAAKTASISNSAENSATSTQGSGKAALSGTSPEIDTAFNTFTLKEFTLNYSTEVDFSNIFSFTSTSGITTATSAELASNVTTTKTLNVLPGTSAASAGNFTSNKILQLPTSTETTTANTFTYSQLSGITTASESSMALGFSFAGTVVLGKALESAFAKTITASKVVLTNLAAETSLSNQLTTAKSLTLTLASELNTAASFLYSSVTGIGTAFSAETATSVLGTIYATLYPSLENNIVLGITSETINWDFAVKTLKIIKTSRKVTIN